MASRAILTHPLIFDLICIFSVWAFSRQYVHKTRGSDYRGEGGTRLPNILVGVLYYQNSISFQLQGGYVPLTPDPGALPLDHAGGSASPHH